MTVANSLLKEKHEPYFVAQAIIDEMAFLLRKYHDFMAYKKIAILGAGRVGRGIALLLNKLYVNLTAIDHNQENLNKLKASNNTIKTNNKLTSPIINNVNIIIGATGNPSFQRHHLLSFIKNNQPDLILVSASSKEIEFKEAMISMEEFINNPETLNKMLDNKVKKLTILADGYPVIFFPNKTNGASNRAMDPIMSELFLAACLMKRISTKLPINVTTMTDIKKIRLPKGPWLDLVDESQILKKWCYYNRIDFKTYCQKIGY